MSIEPGKYIIRCGDNNVSGYDGKVVLGGPPSIWVFDRPGDSDDRREYIITNQDGDSVANIDGRLESSSDTTKWIVERAEVQGDNSYIISSSVYGSPLGWVAPENTNEQILCRVLITFPSYPPRYPPNEVFEIVKDD
ncbi:serine protease inhibitor [Lentinula raphanica]|nr:serine protease inhibitor [Lentinula raphanica]